MSDRQPDPIPNDGVSIWQLVMQDFRAREEFGMRKYGTPLQINNGRDHLRDAYEEALDQAVYLRQEIEARAQADCGPERIRQLLKAIGEMAAILEWLEREGLESVVRCPNGQWANTWTPGQYYATMRESILAGMAQSAKEEALRAGGAD